MDNQQPLRPRLSPLWIAVLVGSAVLLVVFIYASVDMVRVAIQSQPECVAHDRVGESSSSSAMAAKSSC